MDDARKTEDAGLHLAIWMSNRSDYPPEAFAIPIAGELRHGAEAGSYDGAEAVIADLMAGLMTHGQHARRSVKISPGRIEVRLPDGVIEATFGEAERAD